LIVDLKGLALPPAAPRIFAKVFSVGKLEALLQHYLLLDWQ